MEKTKSVIYFLCAWFSLVSCDNGKQDSKLDYEQFEYIKKIDPGLNFDAVLELIPENAKVIGNSEIGFSYSWEHDFTKHELSCFFYGNENFSELILVLDFSKKPEFADFAMNFVNKALENKFGKPQSYQSQDTDVLLEWSFTGDLGHYIISLNQQKESNIIQISHIKQADDNVDNEENKSGEWVQRGPDGDWVWVPN